MGGIDLDWLSQELNWSRFEGSSTGFSEEYHGALREAGDPPFSQPQPYLAEICLQVIEEKRCLAERGNDGRVVRVESQLVDAGRCRHFVVIQAEQDRVNYCTLIHASLIQRQVDVAVWKDSSKVRPCR
jgi:hypothetical protein